MSEDAKDCKPQSRRSVVMAGHGVDADTDEAFVALISGTSDIISRLSVAGARILAAQIVQWADHAEKRNADRPKETVMRFMYRALDGVKQWQPVDNVAKAADPNEGKPGYVRKPYSTEWVAEDAEPGIRSATPGGRKTKKAKRGRKTKKAKRGRK